MVLSVLWGDVYTCTHTHPAHTKTHTHIRPGASETLYNSNPYEVRGHIPLPDFLGVRPAFGHSMCTYDTFSPLLLSLSSPSGSHLSYFFQMTGVIEEKWFMPLSFFNDSGERARRTSKVCFALVFCCLSCSAFAKIVRTRVQCTQHVCYVTWSKNMLWHQSLMGPPPSRSTGLAYAKSGWKTVSMELCVEKDR